MAVREVKLCLLGDAGVGKSSIVLRFVRDQYKESLEATIGASFMTKRLVVDNNTFVFQIWDTAGQEKYRSLAPMYYRGASAAIVVYDVTREASFNTVKDWVRELQKNATMNMVIAIAGNKCDLDDLREVSLKDGQDYASQINGIFTETSALTAANVQELFESIAKKLPLEEVYKPSIRGNSVVTLRHSEQEQNSNTTKTSCCGGNKS